jgi:hypothetical protein
MAVRDDHLHTREETTVVLEHISQEVGEDYRSDARRVGTQQDTQRLVTQHVTAKIKDGGQVALQLPDLAFTAAAKRGRI